MIAHALPQYRISPWDGRIQDSPFGMGEYKIRPYNFLLFRRQFPTAHMIQHGHPDRDAVFHLFQDVGLAAVATSELSSTPLLIGPGCMTMASFFASFSTLWFRPK